MPSHRSISYRENALRRGKGFGRAVADLRTTERGRRRCAARAGQTLAEFIEWAKARSNGISIGSPGPGTTPHLSGVLFAARTGINAVHVPFRGAAQTIPAMLAGDVTFAVDNLASYISQIEAGTMRAHAVTSARRWPTLPKVPTMAETGVPNFVVTSWAAYVMPIATRPAIVDKLATAQKEIATEQSMQNRFLAAGARLFFEHTGRGRSSRRQRNRYVARGGAPLRSDAAVNTHTTKPAVFFLTLVVVISPGTRLPASASQDLVE
jgi:Tripartite tricarboxylate transporter family receptor